MSEFWINEALFLIVMLKSSQFMKHFCLLYCPLKNKHKRIRDWSWKAQTSTCWLIKNTLKKIDII